MGRMASPPAPLRLRTNRGPSDEADRGGRPRDGTGILRLRRSKRGRVRRIIRRPAPRPLRHDVGRRFPARAPHPPGSSAAVRRARLHAGGGPAYPKARPRRPARPNPMDPRPPAGRVGRPAGAGVDARLRRGLLRRALPPVLGPRRGRRALPGGRQAPRARRGVHVQRPAGRADPAAVAARARRRDVAHERRRPAEAAARGADADLPRLRLGCVAAAGGAVAGHGGGAGGGGDAPDVPAHALVPVRAAVPGAELGRAAAGNAGRRAAPRRPAGRAPAGRGGGHAAAAGVVHAVDRAALDADDRGRLPDGPTVLEPFGGSAGGDAGAAAAAARRAVVLVRRGGRAGGGDVPRAAGLDPGRPRRDRLPLRPVHHRPVPAHRDGQHPAARRPGRPARRFAALARGGAVEPARPRRHDARGRVVAGGDDARAAGGGPLAGAAAAGVGLARGGGGRWHR